MKNLFYIAILILANACVVEQPGEGQRAAIGYQMCDSIIKALEVFHKDSSYYPADLYALIPQYMQNIPSKASKYRLMYELPDSLDKSYALQFTYYGPGTNVCNYTPKTKWRCLGFY